MNDVSTHDLNFHEIIITQELVVFSIEVKVNTYRNIGDDSLWNISITFLFFCFYYVDSCTKHCFRVSDI